MLEVIASSLTEAIQAEEAGADRIELISGISDGGLTPSHGLIASVIESVLIPVNVMVRPHSYSFHYNEDDLITMLMDIRLIRELGADGIVIGCLNEHNQIDVLTLEKLLYEANGLDVTFHRAFDKVPDQMAALELLLEYKDVSRVLTSGGKPSVLNAQDRIKQMVTRCADEKLSIMAGCGLTVDALPDFLQATGVTEVHFGAGVRKEGKAVRQLDPEGVAAAKRIMSGVRI